MNNPTETLRKIRQYKAEVKAIRARDAKVGKFSKKIGNLSVKVGESLKKEKLGPRLRSFRKKSTNFITRSYIDQRCNTHLQNLIQ